MAVHGFPRSTKGIELLVLPADVDRVVLAVASPGFTVDAGELPFDSHGPHARRVRRVSKADGREVLTLDLVILPSWLADVWETREAVEWEGREIAVVSREGLLAMKRAAGRPQDFADNARLMGEADEEA